MRCVDVAAGAGGVHVDGGLDLEAHAHSKSELQRL